MTNQTSIIPAFLVPLVSFLVPQPCFDEYFVAINFLNVGCHKVVFSKILGFGIILGSMLVKVPQILKIVRANSAQGINVISVHLELTAITAAAAYGFARGFPFSAYGEAAFLGIQTITIGFMVYWFQGKHSTAIMYLAAYGGILGYLMSPLVPMQLLSLLQACNSVIILSSKMVQAVENYRNSSTGQLSAITVYMLFLGSIARIFTSIQETGDSLMVLTYVVATFSNAILTFQMLYYWNVKPVQKKKKKKQ